MKTRVLMLWAGAALFVIGWGCGEKRATEPANRPPVLEAQPDTTVAVGDTLELWARAQDADGDSLSYRVTVYLTYQEYLDSYRPEVRMNGYTGHFWFKPVLRDGPSRAFMFKADDNRGGLDSAYFVVNVTEILILP